MVIDRIEDLLPLAQFLGRILGDETEVVLQKTAGENQGIVFISGGLSGRQTGDPVSAAVRVAQQSGAYRACESLVKCSDEAGRHTPIKTSVLYLTSAAGELLGTLHINTDLTQYAALGQRLLAYAGVTPSECPSQTPYTRAADAAPGFTGLPLLDETLLELGLGSLPPDRLTDGERRAVVGLMNAKGAFDYKGAVPQAAAALHISESTVYRYIKLESR